MEWKEITIDSLKANRPDLLGLDEVSRLTEEVKTSKTQLEAAQAEVARLQGLEAGRIKEAEITAELKTAGIDPTAAAASQATKGLFGRLRGAVAFRRRQDRPSGDHPGLQAGIQRPCPGGFPAGSDGEPRPRPEADRGHAQRAVQQAVRQSRLGRTLPIDKPPFRRRYHVESVPIHEGRHQK